MERLTVYRIETRHGAGLYAGSDYANDYLHDTAYLHPLPRDDAKLSPIWNDLGTKAGRGSYRFGFSSLPQLKRWVFSQKARDRIDAEGLVISVFEAEGYDGDTQCIYHEDTRGETIETLRLTEI